MSIRKRLCLSNVLAARRGCIALLMTLTLLAGRPLAANAQDYTARVNALTLAQQADSLYRAGRYAEALPLAERAVALAGEGSFDQSINIQYRLVSPGAVLARLCRAKGDYQRAEALFRHLLPSRDNTRADTPAGMPTAAVLNELATLYEAKGDYPGALELRVRANEIIEDNLRRYLMPAVEKSAANSSDVWRNRTTLVVAGLTGAESYRQVIADAVAQETQAVLSLHVQRLPQDRQAAQFAATTILRRKGRVLDAMADQLNVLRRYGTPQDQQLIARLTKAYARLAAVAHADLLTPSAQSPFDSKLSELQKALMQGAPTERLRQEMRREIDVMVAGSNQIFLMTQELGELENAISQRSAELRAPEPPVTLAAVRQAIPADAALVEFFSYKPFDAKKETDALGAPHYVAYVLRRNEEVPQWVDLGNARGIDEAVDQFRAALRNTRRADVRELGRALDERIMHPVRKLLGQTRRLLIAPDGVLNLIPFAALVDEEGQWLVESYNISYVTSGRDLLRLQAAAEHRGAPYVFADPLFDQPASTVGPAGMGRQESPRGLQTGTSSLPASAQPFPFQPLPGTAAEAATLAALFPDAQVLTQARATEAALKNVRRPRLLHIATHGFFLNDDPAGAASADARLEQQTPGVSMAATARAFNPLLRAGLILAGVGQRASGPEEDGVLTALELAGLDLLGTKLVVLSACETGLGDVKTGEGVYGLRRALVLAGSQTQVMSLWLVSDTGTRDLMVAYYTLLQQGAGRTDALRQVQLMMLSGRLLPAKKAAAATKRELDPTQGGSVSPDYRHPYFWAAFIPSGDWRNLLGQEQ